MSIIRTTRHAAVSPTNTPTTASRAAALNLQRRTSIVAFSPHTALHRSTNFDPGMLHRTAVQD
ncbi:hypothetical protein B7435_30180 [Mycolicibacterium peregrinum]|nr:hypothetical protein B7435_30180 [Mycolicibacterium peregrinum]